MFRRTGGVQKGADNSTPGPVVISVRDGMSAGLDAEGIHLAEMMATKA